MLYDENKAFPYPVLRSNSDYGKFSFQGAARLTLAKNKNKKTTNNYLVTIDFMSLDVRTYEPSVRNLIKTNKARRAVLVTCASTFYRELFYTSGDKLRKEISKGSLDGEVHLQSLVVATKEIRGHKSPNINSEFGQKSFNFHKGAVVAIGGATSFFVNLPHLKGKGKSFKSAFNLQEDPFFKGPGYYFSKEDDIIFIYVSEELFNRIQKGRNDPNALSYIITSVYMPVIMDILYEMRENPEKDKGKSWFSAFESRLLSKGIDLAKTDDGPAVVAQRLLDWPMKNLPLP